MLRSAWRCNGFAGIALWTVVAVASFHAGYLIPGAGFLTVGFLYGLSRLSEAERPRWAFYPALLVGIACYGPHLWFFTGIFGPIAFSLWTILALPLGAFVLISRGIRRWPGMPGWLWPLFLPVLWTGLEYFRCELYYLKFAWLTPGIALGPGWLTASLGGYGATTMLMLAASYGTWATGPQRGAVAGRYFWHVLIVLVALGMLVSLLTPALAYTRRASPRPFQAVGIQMEGASDARMVEALNRAAEANPEVPLLIMSEYALAGAPPQAILDWCRTRRKYLIIGGVQEREDLPVATNGKRPWTDTAFVIGPTGEVEFTQGKSVPIQFMADGLPAKEQRVWYSPWGRIGICICYDMSYTRVIDSLVRQGAQVLIVPTMDAESWGRYEHELHARVTRLRAAEYQMPIVRVASSGISQVVDQQGRELARADFAQNGAVVLREAEVGALRS